MVESWETDRFYFHHGHCAAETESHRIQIIGHHHPAGVITDGAGLRLKCPAFVQQASCWIMPAFSPWASGTRWTGKTEQSRMLALHAGSGVLRLPEQEQARRYDPRARASPAISDVQCGQRVALIGIVIEQNGQSFETGVGVGLGRFILLTARTSRKMQNATMRKLTIKVMKVPVVPGDRAGLRGLGRRSRRRRRPARPAGSRTCSRNRDRRSADRSAAS